VSIILSIGRLLVALHTLHYAHAEGCGWRTVGLSPVSPAPQVLHPAQLCGSKSQLPKSAYRSTVHAGRSKLAANFVR
jgi:hypothetical protein